MGIENLLSWYQKKIGTYDKQPWEKTIEQRILHGLNNIQLKTAKPKTDLIDLDLVRGSSFTKAKPKHGFCTVFRLSILRIVFLPLYSKWWVRQTSGRIFLTLLFLYLLQLFNIGIYSYNSKDLNIPMSEFVVPILMIWILSFVHSQVVATNPGPEFEHVQTACKKNYKRRVRKSQRVKIDCTQGPARAVVSPNDKNVLFQENDVIIPNEEASNNLYRNRVRNRHGQIDDDGFESLNGNGSSPSDNGETDKSPVTPVHPPKKARSSGIRCNEWVHSLPLRRRQSAPDIQSYRRVCDTDSDTSMQLHLPRTASQTVVLDSCSSIFPFVCGVKQRLECACDTDEEGECETLSSPDTVTSGQIEANASGNEWIPIGLTTTCEDCSYSSEMSESDGQYDLDAPPNSILSPYCGPSDRVSCTIWDHKETKKADLSVIEISSVIIAQVETMPGNTDCFYMGMFITTIISILPILCRFCDKAIDTSSEDELHVTIVQITHLFFSKFSESSSEILISFFGTSYWERIIMLTAAIQRFIIGFFLFFLLSVAERTFKQRFLYAKLFSHLTSSRRARKSDLPHFRLNKVRNIITWLSVRSYLKKRGPQRSVEVIVSAAFIANLLLLSILCMELLKDTFVLNSQFNLEILMWSLGLGLLSLRFLILGIKINKKYRNLSVLITEQINLYLQIEQKPHKKEELMVANSVLKLAADLLKELESQCKILGLSANPVLYNITKVVILSALSGVLSEILGFKLKLHKIKIK